MKLRGRRRKLVVRVVVVVARRRRASIQFNSVQLAAISGVVLRMVGCCCWWTLGKRKWVWVNGEQEEREETRPISWWGDFDRWIGGSRWTSSLGNQADSPSSPVASPSHPPQHVPPALPLTLPLPASRAPSQRLRRTRAVPSTRPRRMAARKTLLPATADHVHTCGEHAIDVFAGGAR
jgi:hypothetical protein